MAISELAPRILNLPDDVRAALARVDGPGWLVVPDGSVYVYTASKTRDTDNGKAWFPANPAASVAAIFGGTLREAHYNLALAMDRYQTLDDHAAALSIIEAHVAGRGPS